MLKPITIIAALLTLAGPAWAYDDFDRRNDESIRNQSERFQRSLDEFNRAEEMRDMQRRNDQRFKEMQDRIDKERNQRESDEFNRDVFGIGK